MPKDWFLQVPLSALLELESLPQQLDAMRKENDQLRRELDALRRMYFELLEKLADMKRADSDR